MRSLCSPGSLCSSPGAQQCCHDPAVSSPMGFALAMPSSSWLAHKSQWSSGVLLTQVFSSVCLCGWQEGLEGMGHSVKHPSTQYQQSSCVETREDILIISSYSISVFLVFLNKSSISPSSFQPLEWLSTARQILPMMMCINLVQR